MPIHPTRSWTVFHLILRLLEPWAWICSFICWIVVTLLVVPVPAILLAGLSLGPIISFGRRTFKGVLTCMGLGLIALMQSLPPSKLPDLAAYLLIDILFALLWWIFGQALGRIQPRRFWSITLCWSYRWLAVAGWGITLFRIYYAFMYGPYAPVPRSIGVSTAVNGLVLSVTIPLMFIIPPTIHYGQSNKKNA